VKLPSESAPGLFFFSRGLHDEEFSMLDCVLQQSLWCEAQEDIQPHREQAAKQ